MKLIEIRNGNVEITESTGYRAESMFDQQFSVLTKHPITGALDAVFVLDDGGSFRQYWMRGYDISRFKGTGL